MQTPRFADLVLAFARIGVLSFGGAAAQIALMHRVVVDEKGWVDERRYLHALNYCMLLPGPEAQQLATYVGWMTHGVRGGLAAGVLFILPGAVAMMALAALYALGAGLAPVEGLFLGVKAAVLAIVAQALLRIAGKGARTPALKALAVVAFAALLFLDAPFPLIVLGAGAVGALMAQAAPGEIGLAAGGDDAPTPGGDGRRAAALRAALWCLAAWWAPIALAALLLGGDHVLTQVGLFFSWLAVVTFGGAYAVLAYLSKAAVEAGWVSPAEMIDGLGLAETTPGPTILVNQFVGFLAGLRAGEGESFLMAALAAAMAVWATFAPSFLWIFAGAPFVEDIRRNRRLAGALAGVTAAVVGVIAVVALRFALAVLFGVVEIARLGPLRAPVPDPASLDPVAAALAALGALLIFRARWGVMATVGLLAALGLALGAAGL
jgi:chromate transporter